MTAIDLSLWFDAKQWIVEVTGLDRDALHVIGGTLGLFVMAFIARRTIAHWLPWSIVLAFQLANEAHDLLYETWPEQSLQIEEGVKDIVSTMLLPTVLMILAARVPRLFRKIGPETARASEAEEASHHSAAAAID